MKDFHFTIFDYPRLFPFQKIYCLAQAFWAGTIAISETRGVEDGPKLNKACMHVY